MGLLLGPVEPSSGVSLSNRRLGLDIGPSNCTSLSILDFFFSSSCQLSRWFSVLPIVPVHGSPTNTHFVKLILSSARDVLFILSISGRFCTPGKVQVKSMIMGSLVQVWNQTLSLVLLHYLIKKWGKYRQWRDRLSRKVFDKIMTSLPYELCILCRANY